MPRNPSFETFVWRGISCRVTIRHDDGIDGWTTITVTVIEPSGEPLPFAIGGYARHGLERTHLDAAGGVQSFLTEWAERKAATLSYAVALARWQQRDLFSESGHMKQPCATQSRQGLAPVVGRAKGRANARLR